MGTEAPAEQEAASASTKRTFRLKAIAKRRGFPELHLTKELDASRGKPYLSAWTELNRYVKCKHGSLTVVVGQRGTGKTQMAVDMAIDAFAWDPERHAPMYVKISEIFREIRGSFRKESIESEAEVLSKFTRPKLLIIDEAQERGETPFEDRNFTYIIDRRYDAMVHTIIISNLRREALGEALGPSIISRLHETGGVIECNWPSFRERK